MALRASEGCCWLQSRGAGREKEEVEAQPQPQLHALDARPRIADRARSARTSDATKGRGKKSSTPGRSPSLLRSALDRSPASRTNQRPACASIPDLFSLPHVSPTPRGPAALLPDSTACCASLRLKQIMSLTNADPLDAARSARLASRALAVLPTQARNDALTAIHDALAAARDDILAANSRDLAAASQAAQSGELKESLVKRLDLGRKGKYEDMLQGILDVRSLPDPRTSYSVLCLIVFFSPSFFHILAMRDHCPLTTP